jgi:hypothetical protein
MKLLKTILRLVVSCLFCILIAFWAVFIFYTIFYLVESGPDRVVRWYMHISRRVAHPQCVEKNLGAAPFGFKGAVFDSSFPFSSASSSPLSTESIRIIPSPVA